MNPNIIFDDEDPVYWAQFSNPPPRNPQPLQQHEGHFGDVWGRALRHLLILQREHINRIPSRRNFPNQRQPQQRTAIFVIQNIFNPAISWATTQYRPMNAITPEIVLDGLETLLQSVQANEGWYVANFRFGFVFKRITTRGLPRQRRPRDMIGAGKTVIPRWVTSSGFKETWKEQSFAGTKVNCGAFAIAFHLVTSDRPNWLNRTGLRAHALMDQFQWGETVTGLELGRFVEVYTEYRLTIILPSVKSYASDTFTGSSYVLDIVPDRNKLTPECRKKTIYLVWDPTTLHFGGTTSPQLPYSSRKSDKYNFCHRCISCVIGICTCDKPPAPNKIKVLKPCVFCKRTPCMKTGCTRNCPTCGVKYKYGYNRGNGEGSNF